MPEVIYNGPQARVNPRPGNRLSSAGASPAAFGGIDAQNLGNFGKAMGDIADPMLKEAARKQERDDTRMVLDTSSAFQQALTTKMLDDRKSRRGAAADGLIDENDEWSQKAFDEHMSKLTTDRQREAFRREGDRLRRGLLDTTRRWQDQELDNAEEMSVAGKKQANINSAITDPAQADMLYQQNRALAIGRLTKKGVPVEAIEQEVLKEGTALYGPIVLDMSEQNPHAARDFLASRKDTIEPHVYEKLNDQVEKGIVRIDALAIGQQAAATRQPIDKALDAVREKFKGTDFVDLAETQVKQAYGEKKAADNARADAMFNNLQRIANSKGYSAIPQKDLDALNLIDPSKAASLYRGRRTEAENMSRDGRPVAKVDDLNVYTEAYRSVMAGDVKTPADLEQYRVYLTNGTLVSLRKLVVDRERTPASAINDAFMARLPKGRASTAKMNDDDRRNLIEFTKFVQNDTRETKRPEDVAKLADMWFMEGRTLREEGMFEREPNTYGEARVAGAKDFVINTPEFYAPAVDTSTSLLRLGAPPPDVLGGAVLRPVTTGPEGSEDARDVFYTNYFLAAERWLDARGRSVGEELPHVAAAIALLRDNKKKLTTEAVDAVATWYWEQDKGAGN